MLVNGFSWPTNKPLGGPYLQPVVVYRAGVRINMKVLTVSDRVDPALYEHFDRARWRDIDLLISCGIFHPTISTFSVLS